MGGRSTVEFLSLFVSEWRTRAVGRCLGAYIVMMAARYRKSRATLELNNRSTERRACEDGVEFETVQVQCGRRARGKGRV